MTTPHSRAHVLVSGLASLVGILLILIGIPLALATLGGNPLTDLPSTLEDARWALSHPDDGRIFVALMTIVGWGVWATLAASFLVEIPAAFRGVPAPRLPGMSWQQGRAAAMTGAVAAMLAVGGATTATATPAAHSTTAASTAVTDAASDQGAEQADSRQASLTVRTGDTLWNIADEELGDGSRYDEIKRDSKKISDPDVIQPGWKLDLPTQQRTGQPDTPAVPSEKTKAKASTGQSPSAGTQTPDHPTGQAGSDSSAAGKADTSTADRARPSIPSVSGAPTTHTDTAVAATQDGDRLPIAAKLGLGTLAAAGLLTLLLRHRRQQDRHRRPGHRIALPTGAAAAVEDALREAADPIGVNDLDHALRALGHGATTGTHHLPTLRAARLLPDRIEMYTVEEDEGLLPSPWLRVDQVDAGSAPQPGTWVLLRRDLPTLTDGIDLDEVPAPWPAMVTVGFDEHNAHVLLNLEQIGSLGITGDEQTATDVIAGLGIELITSTWCDSAQITLVGVMPELVNAIGNERVTHASDMDHVLASLEHSSAVYRRAFDREEIPDAATARAKGVVDEAWMPHLILTGQPLTHEQTERLRSTLEGAPRVAVAAITSATTPTGPWVLDVHPGHDGVPVADLAPAGMRLVPQHLKRQAYLDQLALFEATSHDDVPGPAWAEGIADATPFDLADLPLPTAPTDTDTRQTRDTNELDTAEQKAPTVGYSIQPINGAGEYGPSAVSASSWITSTDLDANVVETTADAQDEPESTPAIDNAAPPADRADETTTASDTVTQDANPTTDEIAKLPGATGPLIRILGKVEIIGAHGPRPASQRRITEVVTYLAMHPSDAEGFSHAIFPGEEIGPKLSHKRQTYMTTARRWLGRDPQGHPYVAEVDDSDLGYRVTPDVTLDWHHMQALIGEDITHASDGALHEALTLVTETPFSGIDPTRWDWAATEISEVCATVADIAHELATRALRTGDSRTATWAVAKGLMAEPVSEVLWRDQITAAWASGVPGHARTTISEARSALEPLGDDLEDDTISLINDVIAQERRHA